MKMEVVEQELQAWGELIITTASGESYEIHLGDTVFDTKKRMIRLNSPDAHYLIDGDSVENITKHYGHKVMDN